MKMRTSQLGGLLREGGRRGPSARSRGLPPQRAHRKQRAQDIPETGKATRRGQPF